MAVLANDFLDDAVARDGTAVQDDEPGGWSRLRSASGRLMMSPNAVPLRADRPDCVPGPLGQPLTLDMLPPPETHRWVARRKAEVLAAINGGLLTAMEACARYRLSPEELELWQKAIERAGIPGLRVTRIQLYRDDYQHMRHQRHGARETTDMPSAAGGR